MDTIGRNDICPCGSGKKYKKCCLGKKEYFSDSTSRIAKAVWHIENKEVLKGTHMIFDSVMEGEDFKSKNLYDIEHALCHMIWEQGNYEKALQLINACENQKITFSQASYMKCYIAIYRELFEYDKAVEKIHEFRNVISNAGKITPELLGVLREAINVYIYINKYEDAREVYDYAKSLKGPWGMQPVWDELLEYIKECEEAWNSHKEFKKNIVRFSIIDGHGLFEEGAEEKISEQLIKLLKNFYNYCIDKGMPIPVASRKVHILDNYLVGFIVRYSANKPICIDAENALRTYLGNFYIRKDIHPTIYYINLFLDAVFEFYSYMFERKYIEKSLMQEFENECKNREYYYNRWETYFSTTYFENWVEEYNYDFF